MDEPDRYESYPFEIPNKKPGHVGAYPGSIYVAV